jgi:hypothetical protein
VNFVGKKEEETSQSIVLGRTKTNNSLGNGGGRCMAYTPEVN